ncbi:MAG TPA: DUF6265 family protein [Chitinophaga sp.]|uniref:DUF6265 family protein n=1 Tax=Chitinophaga sp. TaxID=1869181 RepID=UPI002DBDCC6D|nr:DUF6265 family protein [Chitinophaga sp.]HEU4555651.1 DUF6265 family protein [Chitinophaga sp.]
MEKKRWYSNSLLLLLLCCSLAAAGQVRTADFHYLDLLEGTWNMRTRQSVITEQWHKVNDSTWQGHTWRITGRDSSLQESMQLIRTADGIYYIPIVMGQHNNQPVRFKLTVLKPIGFIAENPAHDFPKKITYRWKNETHLDAKVEGRQGNTEGEFIFQYTKE